MNQYRQLTSEEGKIVGTYEAKEGDDTTKYDLRKDGTGTHYATDPSIVGGTTTFKYVDKRKWSIVGQEVHIESIQEPFIHVCRINADGNLTSIAYVHNDGQREDFPKDKRATFIKIN